MKIGLKLCSALMVLPLVMGVQKHHSDSHKERRWLSKKAIFQGRDVRET